MSSKPEPKANVTVLDDGPMGELVRRISDDLTTIAKDVVALGRIEITRDLRSTLMDVGGIVLGGVVALIALGLLAAAVAVVLEPLIPSLAVRLFIMTAAYALSGIAVAGVYIKRMKGDSVGAPRAQREAASTIEAITEKVQHG
jgi:hypothetical protein